MGEDFFDSNFWVFLLTMFAIGPWHGALEMKLLHESLRPPLRRVYGSQRHQVHPLQPVRVLRPPAGQMARGARRHDRVRHAGHQRPVRHHRPSARSLAASNGCDAEQRGGVDVTENDLVFITNGSPVENTRVGGSPHPRHVGHARSGRAASGRCGATSPRRTRPSAGPTSSAPTPTRAAMSRLHRTLDDKVPPYIERSASATRSRSTASLITGGNW